jgi:hypothetical protein
MRDLWTIILVNSNVEHILYNPHPTLPLPLGFANKTKTPDPADILDDLALIDQIEQIRPRVVSHNFSI